MGSKNSIWNFSLFLLWQQHRRTLMLSTQQCSECKVWPQGTSCNILEILLWSIINFLVISNEQNHLKLNIGGTTTYFSIKQTVSHSDILFSY